MSTNADLTFPPVQIAYPEWVATSVDWAHLYLSDDEKMRLAVGLARENVARETGGPFGAAVFERSTGALVSVGVNLVVANNNSVLHGEIVAIMMAQARLASYSLSVAGGAEHELFTSCEPCAMCLGATLWSGVHRLVCAATGKDARALGFDEGPVFEASYDYLSERGVEIEREVRRADGREALELYMRGRGLIYNA